jgi:DNA-binding transcriptional MerR regulator
MSNTNYFSVSELAALGNVSRQTILYYDKHNLLKPNFIDSNGYRYYHFKEYLILEIILNFRKLGMSVDEIKAYINEKSPEALDNILMNKAAEYELTIKKLKCLLADIEIVRTNLAAINKYNVGSLTIHQQEQEILILSPLVDKKAPIKTRIKILGNFNLPLYKSNHFKSCKVSWIITANDFLNGECRKKRYYCSPTYVDSNNKKKIILPAGNYLTYIFQEAFQPQATKIYDIITQYLHKQHLKIISPIKITTLKDFWTAKTRDDYISMLSVAVEKE